MKKTIRLVFIPALLLAVTGTVWGQSAGDWESGEQIYAKVCQYCHASGVGVVITGRRLPPAYIRAVARNGLRAMPAFRQSELSDADIDKVADYVSGSAAQ